MLMNRRLKLGLVVAALAAAVVISLACGSDEPTPVPAPQPTAAPVLVPTAVPAPTARPIPAAPTPVSKEGQPVYGGTLRFVGRMGVTKLDPALVILSGSYAPMYAMFNNIVKLMPDGTLGPGLAESWESSADGKTITLHLQKGVKFHDGTDFNAQAVKAHFDRILDPDTISPRRSNVEPHLDSMQVLDSNTIQMRLKRAFRPFLAQLTDRTGWIPSPTALKEMGEDFGAHPIGTGPFKFSTWIPGRVLKLVRNDNYWEKGKPYLDGIEHQIMDVREVGFAMVRTSESDLGEAFRCQDIPLVKANPNLKLSPPLAGRAVLLNFNVGVPPFDNKALRQAIAHSIDRETAVDVAFAGCARPAHTLIQSGWAHNPDLKPITYDTEKAKQKLAEAGYPNGITIPLACRSSQDVLLQCEIYQAMMSRVGINAEINVMPTGDLLGPEGGLLRLGLGHLRWSPRADPHILLNWLAHSESTAFPYKASYSNPEINRLLDQAGSEYDVSKAKELYDRVQTILALDAPYVFIVWRQEFISMNKRVQNFAWSPDQHTRLRDLWLEK